MYLIFAAYRFKLYFSIFQTNENHKFNHFFVANNAECGISLVILSLFVIYAKRKKHGSLSSCGSVSYLRKFQNNLLECAHIL